MTQQTPTSPADGVSVVMPAFNEERGIVDSIRGLRAVMDAQDRTWELLVVDDGSADRTAELAEREGATVVSHPRNRGYGAALKTGIARAKYDTIVITDADGTYPPEAIPAMLAEASRFDMVVAARIGEDVNVPLARRPAKWVLRRLAAYLAGQPIPDLNSGLRVIQRSLIERFEHILPSGFSFTTTITLAALCNDALVEYHTIDYHPRQGESKIRPAHAFDFLMLILRTVVYFNPLKVFLPLGGFFMAGGVGKLAYDFVIGNVSESAVMGILGGALLWSLGLLSDQIARVGLGSRKH